jgi:long-subunit acyl-CoA synthetase (AMP-forming)
MIRISDYDSTATQQTQPGNVTPEVASMAAPSPISNDSAAQPPRHVLDILFAASAMADAPLFIDPRGNMVRKYTKAELAAHVSRFARGMAATELRNGKRIAIVARTSFASMVASLATMLNGCSNIVIPVTASPEQQQQALAASSAAALIVDDIASARAILDQVQYLPQLRQIIVLNQTNFAKQPEILCAGWDEVLQRGDAMPDKRVALLAALAPEDDAYTFFTADAGGELQPRIYTHRAVMEQLAAVRAHSETRLRKAGHGQKILSVIPFDTILAHTAGLLLPLALELPFMAVDQGESWKSGNLPIRPTVLVAPSAFLEHTARTIEESFSYSNGITQAMWKQARRWIRRNYQQGQCVAGFFAKLQRLAFKPFLRAALTKELGGNVQLALSINTEIGYDGGGFFAAADMPVVFTHSDSASIQALRSMAPADESASELSAAA